MSSNRVLYSPAPGLEQLALVAPLIRNPVLGRPHHTITNQQVTVIGHSFGGLLVHLAFMRLEEPDWCGALFIEPSHLYEAARSSKRMLEVMRGVEQLRNPCLLSRFGGELLDASTGP